jgi:hypothetical protein
VSSVWQIFAHSGRRAAQAAGPALVAGIALGTLCGFAAPALAETKWTQSQAVWKQMDNCYRAAYKQFPGHTAAANANREGAP